MLQQILNRSPRLPQLPWMDRMRRVLAAVILAAALSAGVVHASTDGWLDCYWIGGYMFCDWIDG